MLLPFRAHFLTQLKYTHINMFLKQTLISSLLIFFSTIIILPMLIYMLSILFLFIRIWSIIGERPEAMQTGTSTYIANNIMQTILISIIISTYNIFQNYYTSILFSSRIPNEITWQTRAIIPKLFGHRTATLTATATAAGTSLILNQYKPYEMSTPERW